MDELVASVAVRVIVVFQGVYVEGFAVTVKVQVAVLYESHAGKAEVVTIKFYYPRSLSMKTPSPSVKVEPEEVASSITQSGIV